MEGCHPRKSHHGEIATKLNFVLAVPSSLRLAEVDICVRAIAAQTQTAEICVFVLRAEHDGLNYLGVPSMENKHTCSEFVFKDVSPTSRMAAICVCESRATADLQCMEESDLHRCAAGGSDLGGLGDREHPHGGPTV